MKILFFELRFPMLQFVVRNCLVSALRVDRRSAPAPPRRGALRGDEELADLAAQGRGVGDDGTEIDVVGHAVEGAAERDERSGVVGRDRVLGIVDDRPGMGQLAPDLKEGRELDGRRFADGAPEQRALNGRVEAVPAVHDVGNHLPRPRAAKSFLAQLGIEQVQHVGAHLEFPTSLLVPSLRHRCLTSCGLRNGS